MNQTLLRADGTFGAMTSGRDVEHPNILRVMMTRFMRSLLMAAIAAAPLSAQTFPVADPILSRIWSMGMESSQTMSLAQALTDSIGPRLTGTPSQKAGNDWLVSMYGKWGIPARNEQYGTWRGWRRGITHVDLISPRVRSLEATMLAWSPGTNERSRAGTVGAPRDVEGTLAILPDLADSAAYARWLPTVRGKFVLVSLPQQTCRPDTNWVSYATVPSYIRMRRQQIADTADWNGRLRKTGFNARTLPKALERAGAAGIFTSNWSRGWGVNKIFQARTDSVPSIDVSCEDYGLLYRLTLNNQRPVIRMRADAQFLGDVPVYNTIAEIRGTEKPNEYVMLSAHFDSWDGSSGATDNATGTVAMLEAMRILKSVYPNPKRTILVGHWSGEEHGLNGSRAFVEDHPEVVKGLQALFNQDNGTGRVSNVGAQGLVGASASLARWASRLPTEINEHITWSLPGSPMGGSDNAAFVCHGAPGFGLYSNSWEYGQYTWHTNRDTYDKIVFDDLRNNATLIAMLAYLASEDPETTPRERRVLPVNRRTGQQAAWPECRKAARSIRESTR